MFEVYLTPDGPKILEGEQRIAIVGSVYRGNRTFSEIMKDTGISKSSVYTFLKKLVNDGFLVVADDDNGTSNYFVKYLLLFKSSDCRCTYRERLSLLDTFVKSDVLEGWAIANMIMGGNLSGLSMHPLLSLMMRDLGERAYERDIEEGKKPSEKRILELLDKCNIATFEAYLDEVPEFDLHLKFDTRPEWLYTVASVVISSLCGYLAKSRNTEYIPIKFETGFNPLRDVKVKIAKSSVIPMGGRRQLVQAERGPCDFSIYYSKEGYVPVVGETMNKIVERLAILATSSQGLSEMFDIPQSTMSGYLKKLEADGVIAPKKIKKNVDYYLCSLKAYDWEHSSVFPDDELRNILDELLDDPEHALHYLFHYSLLIGYSIGFDMDTWANYIGKRAGTNIVEFHPDSNMEELFDLITSNASSVFSSQIAIVSSVPLSITKIANRDMSDFLAEHYRMIYDAMFIGYMETLSHVEYRSKKSQVYGIGNRGYKAVFVPFLG